MTDRGPSEPPPREGQPASDQGKQGSTSVADRGGAMLEPDVTDSSADAASLGFADLAEYPPGVELAAFRDLRARLFGDIVITESGLDNPSDDVEDQSTPVAEPFVPQQVSIANGALTAAEIAEAAEEFAQPVDDEPSPDEATNLSSPSIAAAVLDADIDLAEPPADTDLAEPPADTDLAEPPADTDLAEPPSDVSSAPAFIDAPGDVADPAPPPLPPIASTPPAAAVPAAEPARRKTPVVIALAAILVTVAVVGSIALITRDSSPSAKPAASSNGQAGEASGDTRAMSSASIHIDGQTLSGNEQFVFDAPVAAITISVPPRTAGSAAVGFDPQVSGIEISVPDTPVQMVDELLASGSSITVDLDEPADTIEISYQSAGAVVRTTPSSAQRALALVTPLRVAVATGSSSLISLEGSTVLNLGCTTGGAAPEACGQRTEDGWEVARTAPDTDVVAQINLDQ